MTLPLFRRWLWVPAFAAVFILAGCVSFASDVTPPPGWRPSPIPPTPDWEQLLPQGPLDLEQGAQLYAQRCATCHGPQALGEGELAGQLSVPPTALGDPQVQWAAVPLEWFKVVTLGRLERQMPPFASLTPEQRWNILGYLLTLGLSPEEQDQARQLYQATCLACHGPQAQGDGPQAQGQVPDLSDAQRWAKTSLAQWAEAMSQSPAHEGLDLTPEQRMLVLHYMRTLVLQAGQPPTPTPAPTPTAAAATPTPEAAAGPVPEAAAPPADADPNQPFTITIRGQVLHGGGEPLPPDLPVRLQAFDDFNPVFTLETTTDADGTFTFAEVEAQQHRMFMIGVDYQGVTYLPEDVLVAFADTREYDVQITVYETTTDPSQVVVERLHLFVEVPQEQILRLVELYVITNRGDRTLVAPPGQEGVLEFVLPPGAMNLRFPQEMGALGQRFLATERGFVDTVPLLPGPTRLLFSYDLSYEGGTLEVQHPVPLRVEATSLFLPPGVEVKGQGWMEAGMQTIETMQFQVYQGPSLEAGEVLQVALRARTQVGRFALPGGDVVRQALPVLLIGAGVLLVLVGLWSWRRERRGRGSRGAPAVSGARPDPKALPPALRDNPEALMEAILALDDLYQQGKLDEATYRQRRELYKARLAQLLQK